MSGRESEVLQALQLACSQDPEVMKLGEKQLGSWKAEKNFYATLAVRDEWRDTSNYTQKMKRKLSCFTLAGCDRRALVGSRCEMDGHH